MSNRNLIKGEPHLCNVRELEAKLNLQFIMFLHNFVILTVPGCFLLIFPNMFSLAKKRKKKNQFTSTL